jgi:hypothetical protein
MDRPDGALVRLSYVPAIVESTPGRFLMPDSDCVAPREAGEARWPPRFRICRARTDIRHLHYSSFRPSTRMSDSIVSYMLPCGTLNPCRFTATSFTQGLNAY